MARPHYRRRCGGANRPLVPAAPRPHPAASRWETEILAWQASVDPARPSRARWACRGPPSAWSCAASASAASGRSIPSPPSSATSANGPGELIHIDIKKLGRIDGVGHASPATAAAKRKRGAGWEYLHVAVDDASRLAFTAVMPDERKESAVAFLNNALDWFAAHGVAAQRVMTDNGSASNQLFARAIADHGLRHKRTRPYTPKTNGKAERFIQTYPRVGLRHPLQHLGRPDPRHASLAARTTIAHHNAHLAMSLIGRGFAARGQVPRGVLRGFGRADRRFLAAGPSRSARRNSHGPSSRGWWASISPRSAASRSVRGATPTTAAAWLRLSQGSMPSSRLDSRPGSDSWTSARSRARGSTGCRGPS